MPTSENSRPSPLQFSAVWDGGHGLSRQAPPGPSTAIGTGALVGSVVDAAGLPLPAHVVVRNKGGYVVQEGYTASLRTGSAGGLFSIGGLPPGQYAVEVTAPGFCAGCRSHVRVTPADTTFLGRIRLLPAHSPSLTPTPIARRGGTGHR